jgi:SAM-dependent methyltransferase
VPTNQDTGKTPGQLLRSAARRFLRRPPANPMEQERLTPRPKPAPAPPDPNAAKFEEFFRTLPLSEEARGYMNVHLPRLVRTMTLVPEPQGAKRVLELGAYMQMTPALQEICGYSEVRAADFGKLGERVHKVVPLARGTFTVDVDLFDAEFDRFPYPDGYFSLILCCEMLEHLISDPIRMLGEIRRCLEPGGRLLLSTPNCASLASIASALEGIANPQIFAKYSIGKPEDRPHVREYTAVEVGMLLKAAGFEVEQLLTDRIVWHDELAWVRELLAANHFNGDLRGEQTYCIARMESHLPVERYPKWLYE